MLERLNHRNIYGAGSRDWDFPCEFWIQHYVYFHSVEAGISIDNSDQAVVMSSVFVAARPVGNQYISRATGCLIISTDVFVQL